MNPNARETVQRLKLQMAAKGLSIKTLASVTAIPYRTLQNYLLKTHALPADALFAICKAMSISSDWALSGDLTFPADARSTVRAIGTLARAGGAVATGMNIARAEERTRNERDQLVALAGCIGVLADRLGAQLDDAIGGERRDTGDGDHS
jgi:hypothetical protein